MIPQDFINQVVERTDILALIDPYVKMKKVGQDHVGLCPFHKEKTPSFTVTSKKQFYYCFGCGASGNAIGFLTDHVGLTFPEAVRQLAADTGMPMPEQTEEMLAEAQRQRTQNQLLEDVSAFFRRELLTTPEAIAYLKQRGLNGDTVARFGLGFAPGNSERLIDAFHGVLPLLEANGIVYPQAASGEFVPFFRNRIMFPIRNPRGKLVGFSGRVLHETADTTRKYQNSAESPLFQKRREVYGLAEALPAIKQAGYVIVVEGYMDVLMLHQHQISNVVAGMGTAFTGEQLASLYRHTNKIVFCFDGDSAGLKASRRALEIVLPELVEGKQASFVLLPKDEDPDSLVLKERAEGFLARIETGPTVLDFLFQQLEREHPGTGPESKVAFVAAVREALAKVSSPLLRAAATARLAEITHIDETTLRGNLRRAAPITSSRTVISPVQPLLRLTLYVPTEARDLTNLVLPEADPATAPLAMLLSLIRLHQPETTEELLELAANSPDYDLLLALVKAKLDWPSPDYGHDLHAAAEVFRGKATKPAPDDRVAALKARFEPKPASAPAA